MNLLPGIVASHDSGVTQSDLDAALVALIEKRALDLVHDVARGCERCAEALNAIHASADTSPFTTSRALRVIDTMLEQIHKDRIALEYRLNALNNARTASAPAGADHSLTLQASA